MIVPNESARRDFLPRGASREASTRTLSQDEILKIVEIEKKLAKLNRRFETYSVRANQENWMVIAKRFCFITLNRWFSLY
jgi:hypothetical protein